MAQVVWLVIPAALLLGCERRRAVPNAIDALDARKIAQTSPEPSPPGAGSRTAQSIEQRTALQMWTLTVGARA